jgi:hypothetical protein
MRRILLRWITQAATEASIWNSRERSRSRVWSESEEVRTCGARKEEGARGHLAVRCSAGDGGDASTYNVVATHAWGEWWRGTRHVAWRRLVIRFEATCGIHDWNRSSCRNKSQKECRCFYPDAAMSAPHLPPISELNLGREHEWTPIANFWDPYVISWDFFNP